MTERERCDVCGTNARPEELVEAEIIGRVRSVCGDCHDHLKDVW